MKLFYRAATTASLALSSLLHVPAIDASTAHVSASTSAQQAIEQAYAHIYTAIKRHDFKTATSFYAPDYKQIDIKGRSENLDTKKKFINQLITTKAKNVKYKFNSIIEGCNVKGNVATLRMRVVDSQTDHATSQTSLFYETYIVESKEKWMLNGTRWLWQSSTILSVRTTWSVTPIANL